MNEIDRFRGVINQVKANHPFKMDAMVILPEHFHLMMTLPENDCDFAKRIMLIKSGLSRKIPNTESINPSRLSKRERGIWQRRYWEHLIRDEIDYQRHVDYIHYNPVKHGYVDSPSGWPYSTIHKYIELGYCPKDWGANIKTTITHHFGE